MEKQFLDLNNLNEKFKVCTAQISPTCLQYADEKLFVGRLCVCCFKFKNKKYYRSYHKKQNTNDRIVLNQFKPIKEDYQDIQDLNSDEDTKD